MPAAMLTASRSIIAGSPTAPTSASYTIPDALQQFFDKLEEQCNANLRTSEDLCSLKANLESRWRIASSGGQTSSTMLYEILEYGWKEWRRITA